MFQQLDPARGPSEYDGGVPELHVSLGIGFFFTCLVLAVATASGVALAFIAGSLTTICVRRLGPHVLTAARGAIGEP